AMDESLDVAAGIAAQLALVDCSALPRLDDRHRSVRCWLDGEAFRTDARRRCGSGDLPAVPCGFIEPVRRSEQSRRGLVRREIVELCRTAAENDAALAHS